jgi:hypothetical protein
MTRRVRRRSWAEPAVRVWSILTFLIGVTLVYLAVQNIAAGLTDRKLVNRGTKTIATIAEVNGQKGMAVSFKGSTEDRTVRITFTGAPSDLRPRALENPLNAGRTPGDHIEIRYDPSDPENWTDRTEPQPWAQHLAIVWMLLPALVVALAMLLLRRSQVLALWREGVPTTGTVIDSRQSAIAPRSRVIRFTLAGSERRRILQTFWPQHAGPIDKGDELLMLAPSTGKSRAIVAELYT